ncbi:MAG: hypothetical protein CMC55_04350 [Flavobacteriaceae bacterium]|uniref:T9SS type A sorting domain-containing protein n=1 Tax=Bizionia echini TaxID=649333 RepID=UPI000C965CB3|nr:hypothetical protein [Flavobacteriaceae bacterium]
MRKKLPSIFNAFFIVLFLNSFQVVLAQIAPGGVSTGLSMWLKAENEFTYYNSTDAVWMDQSSNRYTLSANLVLGSDGLSAPTLTSNSINYNPGITFDGSDTGLSTGTDVTGFGYTEWTAFSVQTIKDANVSNCVWHYSQPSNTFALFIDPNSTGFNIAVNNTSQGLITNPLVNDGKPYIIGYNANNQSSQTYVNSKIVNSGSGQSPLPSNGAFMIGLDADGGEGVDGDNHLDGDVGEVIIYNQKLSATDNQKVNSYLSLKYGISLNQTTPTNYVNSNGTVIWDIILNTGYSTDVFGIGTDIASGLDQKVSQSANNSNGPILSTTQHFTQANNDALRTTSLGDGNFIFMAHDDGLEVFNSSFNGESNNRFSRVWKLDETGEVNSVYFAIPKAAYNFPSGVPILVLSNNASFDGNDTVIELLDDGIHYWAQFNPSDAWYLTFASTSTLNLLEVDSVLFSIYPNPVKTTLNIPLKNTINNKLELMLYNITGQLVISEETNTTNGTAKLDMSKLLSGIYMLVIKNGDKQQIKKIIKE